MIPCSDYLHGMPLEQARELIHQFRELVLRAGYYTGATDFLRERAALLGKPSYRIPNGFNQTQIDLSRSAIEDARQERDAQQMRIGYFSGTLTHQSDFRIDRAGACATAPRVPPSDAHGHGRRPPAVPGIRGVHRPRGERPAGLAAATRGNWAGGHQHHSARDQFVHGRQERSEILRGGMVEVPSVASPTLVYQSAIEHGSNGFLARTRDDWYEALRTLIVDSDLRRRWENTTPARDRELRSSGHREPRPERLPRHPAGPEEAAGC